MAKKTSSVSLRFSRIDFFRLSDSAFFEALFQCVDLGLGEGRERVKHWKKLNPLQQGVHAWWEFAMDVSNGGFAQYFYNRTDTSVLVLSGLLKISGNKVTATLLGQAQKIYLKQKKEFAVENPFGDDGLFARMKDLEKLSRLADRQIGRCATQLEKWVRSHFSKIALGDSGEPIDPNFSGEIETHFPNGKLFEKAIVRNGKLNGPYQRFKEQGVLEQSCFYKGGQESADYWPNGQARHKVMKQGKLKVYEWYFESGKIQKRYVADKSDNAVEPIQIWHENGQLAEELHTKKGKKLGPWLKFFEDGSPCLQAEHGDKEKLVVTNAWDDQRRQVVKNGRGTYCGDGRNVDTQYKLFSQSDWIKSEELRNGVRHGKSITWHRGVLYSQDQYVNGQLHGEVLVFHDNGRIQTRSSYHQGKEIKTEEFPKFDHPKPVVVIATKANADLYAGWRRPLLDQYPVSLNLEQLQSKMTIPTFLEEVFERNKSGNLKSSYENIDTFNDSIYYQVSVDANGVIDRIEPTGCAAYSVGVINTYLPLLRKLKFKPGKLGGQKVPSHVSVIVQHTFAEDDAKKKSATRKPGSN